MAEPIGLNGNIKDYGLISQPNVLVSVYHKVGEAISDVDGNYSNIDFSIVSDDYLVEFRKDDYYTIYEVPPQNNVLNVSMQIDDNSTPPDVPTVFRGYDFGTGDSIMLTWTVSSFEYVAGYNIYRSDDILQPFEKVNNSLINDISFLDTGLTSDKDYYYILEVVSANSATYNAGTTYRTAMVGPILAASIEAEDDLTAEANLRVDSAKPGQEGEKVFIDDPTNWWGSKRGTGAWIELYFDEEKYINSVYFLKTSVSKGIIFAKLQYFDGTEWIDIKSLDLLQEIDYIFDGFSIQTDRIRIYVTGVEPLTDTEIVQLKIYGF